jgi:hypothetical protein
MSVSTVSDSLSEDGQDGLSDFGWECLGDLTAVTLDSSWYLKLLGSPVILGVHLTSPVFVTRDKLSGSGIKTSSVLKEDIIVSLDSVPDRPELRLE